MLIPIREALLISTDEDETEGLSPRRQRDGLWRVCTVVLIQPLSLPLSPPTAPDAQRGKLKFSAAGKFVAIVHDLIINRRMPIMRELERGEVDGLKLHFSRMQWATMSVIYK